jgi:hypothetical protein
MKLIRFLLIDLWVKLFLWVCLFPLMFLFKIIQYGVRFGTGGQRKELTRISKALEEKDKGASPPSTGTSG